MEYALLFSRFVVGITFFLSAWGKARAVPAFQQAILRFQILPKWLVQPFAYLMIGGEFLTVLLVALGGNWTWAGLALAILLLLAFTAALLSVLARKLVTSCNCFGSSQKQISSYDVCRNTGFILCALGGWGAYSTAGVNQTLSLAEAGLTGLAALGFVLLLTNIQEIVEILH